MIQDPDSDVTAHQAKQGRPRLAISSCLLGNEVRYDGGHKRDIYITRTLSEHFDLQPVCPEVAIGLDTPRPSMQLRRAGSQVRVVGVKDRSDDVTEALGEFAGRMSRELDGISGYLFKKGSPSCGLWRVPVYPEGDGAPNRSGTGEYTRVIRERLPFLPVEEEGRLNDPVLRENFLVRVFTLFRWQRMASQGIRPRDLVNFHSCHKLILMAYSQQAYRTLGQLVARSGSDNLLDLAGEYLRVMMQTLEKTASRRGHSNVLQHLQGYLKRDIDSEDKQELNAVIDDYRRGRVPLIVPMTLLKHHFRRHPCEYIKGQVYLDPHPAELKLRNLI